MNYSIVGSGKIGTALARQFARGAIPVQIANSRGAASLAPLAEELGGSIVPVELPEALAADIVILALPFAAVPEIMKKAPPWNGRIVIDATNAIDYTTFKPADLGGHLSSDIVAEAAPGAAVVKAFNTLHAAVLAAVPNGEGGRRVVFLSSNDDEASKSVESLVDNLGFAPVALGRIDEGGRLMRFGGPLLPLNLLKQP